mmetsp:Transcript_22950/g.56728  ORF Transcript_22950/g.56728 Transcript_22950/m.56728 type:complete len:255 (+) Transcript_22950:53-817(+)
MQLRLLGQRALPDDDESGATGAPPHLHMIAAPAAILAGAQDRLDHVGGPLGRVRLIPKLIGQDHRNEVFISFSLLLVLLTAVSLFLVCRLQQVAEVVASLHCRIGCLVGVARLAGLCCREHAAECRLALLVEQPHLPALLPRHPHDLLVLRRGLRLLLGNDRDHSRSSSSRLRLGFLLGLLFLLLVFLLSLAPLLPPCLLLPIAGIVVHALVLSATRALDATLEHLCVLDECLLDDRQPRPELIEIGVPVHCPL